MAISPDEAKRQLVLSGVTITDWAKANDFPVRNVRAVLAGHNKGNYGVSHAIAVALKIKDDPDA